MLLATFCTSGAAEVVTDSAYVQRPFDEDLDAEIPQSHLDLWGRLMQARRDRQEPLVVRKVGSHRSAAEAHLERISAHR